MQPLTLIDELLIIFRIISIVGFLATGAVVIGLAYRGYKKLYKEKAEESKHKWLFFAFSTLLIIVLMFMYFILF